MTGAIADLFVVLDSVTDPFSRGMKRAADEAEAQTSRMSSALGLVAKAAVGIGAAALGVGVASVKMATDFQAKMALLDTQAGVSKSQIAGLSAGVLSLAGQVGFSPNSLADALFHIESSFASTGISGQKALDLLRITAEGAAVGHADLVDVTNALDAAIVSGIPGVQDYTQAMGVLNSIVGSGDMTMQQLADAFSTGALANVKSYGATINDVGAALAVFGDNNIRGQNAATDLRMAMQALQVPAKSGAALLEQMGMDTHTLGDAMSKGGLLPALQLLHDKMTALGYTEQTQGAALTELFGKKAGAGIVVLYDQLERLKSKYPDEIAGAQNFAQAWVTTKGTFLQQIKDIGAGVDSLGVRIGLWLIPQVSKLITTVQGAGAGVLSGFTGAANRPLEHDNMHNALLNQEAGAPPPLTGWQRFGQEVHSALDGVRADLVKLEPVGRDFVKFGQDAWAGLGKLWQAAQPVVHLFGGALYLGIVGVGKAFANVVGPGFKMFTDFLANHQGMIKFFAEVILGGLIVKMTILGSLKAAQGIVGLATAITQFPLQQTGQIKDAIGAVKTAWTGKDAKAGEDAIKGLSGAFKDLKGSVGGVLEKIPGLGGIGVKLKGASDGVSEVENAAAGAGSVGKLGGDLEKTAAGGDNAKTSLIGVAGALGKVALPLGVIIGGSGLLGNYLGHLAGVGDHTAQSMDTLNQQLNLAGMGAAQASDGFTKTAVQLVHMQQIAGQMGAPVQGLKDMDTALANLVTSGKAGQAQAQFQAISDTLAAQGVKAKDTAADFPAYEKAIKDAGAAAQTMDGQVQDLLGTLGQQQAVDQFNTDLNNLSTAIFTNGRGLTGNTDAAIANRQAVAQAAGDIESYYTTQRNAGVSIEKATADMQSQVNQLEATGIKAGFSKGEIDDYLKTLGLIPRDVSTSITLNLNTGPAYQSLHGLIQSIDSSTGTVQITGTGGGMYGGGKALYGDGGWVTGGARGAPVPAIVHVGEYVVSDDMQAGRRSIDPRVLSGMIGRTGSTGYAPGAGGPAAGSVTYVTNHFHIDGSVIAEAQLQQLVQKYTLQSSTRNLSNGMSYTPVR